jgi:hypothetical protein
MTNITRALKQSIAFEKSKRDIANLHTHKPEDLSVMIDTITHAINECESDIRLTERTIDNAEDMSEIVENVMRAHIADKRKRIDDLCAWRIIFLTTWTEVKTKK